MAHSHTFKNYDPLSNSYSDNYGVAHPVIFRVDNNKEADVDGKAELIPLSDVPGACGTAVWDAAYSGVNGLLAVAYLDGTIGIYGDDGNVTEITDFRDLNLPIQKKINSVVFDTDGNRVYMAGTFGYLTVDAAKGRMTDICVTPRELGYAFRVGDYMVASDKMVLGAEFKPGSTTTKQYVYSKGKTYVAPVSEAKGNWNSFAPLKVDMANSVLPTSAAALERLVVDGELSSLVYGVPFNDNTLCLVTNPGTTRQLSMATPRANGTWTVIWLEDVVSSYEILPGSMDQAYEGYVCPVNIGWSFWSGANFIVYDSSKNLDVTASDIKNDFKKRSRKLIGLERDANKDTYNRDLKGACWNQQDAWLYKPFTGWERMRYFANDGHWEFLVRPSLPDAPTVSFTDELHMVPGRGLMLAQFIGTYHLSTGRLTEPTYVCVREDGKWKDCSPMSDVSAIYTYANNTGGIAVDPMNPDYYYIGTNSGLLRRKFSDPDDILLLGTPGAVDALKALPGFVEAFPQQTGWKNIAKVKHPHFDAEGNLWFAYQMFDSSDLWACKWERAAIDASLGASTDKTKYVPFKHSFVNTPDANNDLRVYELGHTPEGEDIVLVACPGFEHKFQIVVVDWNAGNADARILFEGCPISTVGDVVHMTDIIDILSLPEKGEVWLGTMEGVVRIKTEEIERGEYAFHTLNPTRKGGGAFETNPFSMVWVRKMAKDPYGRVWIATESGLYCVTADGEELIAHWNANTAPFRGNSISGVIWDTEANCAVVSTEEGVWEFAPYQNSTGASSNLRVWPAAVEPGFHGHVTVSGVSDGTRLVVHDSYGHPIASFMEAAEGSAQWDLKTAGGQRTPPGIYFICRQGSEEKLCKVTVY